MAMVNIGGGFKSFCIRVPLIQICTRLDLLADKRVVPPPAEQKPSRSAKSGLGRKGKVATGVPMELLGEGGKLAVRLQPPPGALPDVIVWEDRFFLLGRDGRYREGHGYHAPQATAKPADIRGKRRRGAKTRTNGGKKARP
jgi:hypothetical protein